MVPGSLRTRHRSQQEWHLAESHFFGTIDMAPRAKSKKTGSPAASEVRQTARTASTKAKAPVAAPQAAELEVELRALRQQLVEAKAEIARLEKRQELVVNRIDWVIDSLHNLLDDED